MKKESKEIIDKIQHGYVLGQESILKYFEDIVIAGMSEGYNGQAHSRLLRIIQHVRDQIKQCHL